jgi:hypothetical protein
MTSFTFLFPWDLQHWNKNKNDKFLVIMSLGLATLEQKNMMMKSLVLHHRGPGDLQHLNKKIQQ